MAAERVKSCPVQADAVGYGALFAPAAALSLAPVLDTRRLRLREARTAPAP